MKKLSMVAAGLVCAVLLTGQAFAQHKYVGVTICKACHNSEKQGKQFTIWSGTKHAEAFQVLQTPRADSIAKAKGLTKPAAESPECLRCHTTGFGSDAALFLKTFDVKNGVQCEACHGAGSDYKSVTVMKDSAKAAAAGLIVAKGDPKLCEKCHNSDSPTMTSFDYATAWEKIKHTMPSK